MRVIGLIAGMVLLGVGQHGRAEPATDVAWTPETLAFVKQGNAAKGREAAESCAVCHGAEGNSEVADFPSLGGQVANYIFRQLQDYKSGRRSNALMAGIAAEMEDQTMADLAAWYSSLPPPAAVVDSAGVDSEILPMVKVGDAKRLIPGCGVCHGARGQGEAMDHPALAGQQPAYLEKTLLDYKQGIRSNDVYSRMGFIARQLTFEEIEALARYYGALKP